MDNGFERTDDDLDFEHRAGSSASGTGSIEAEADEV
jgi:hypothetical protein